MRVQCCHVDVCKKGRFFLNGLESMHMERQKTNGILQGKATKLTSSSGKRVELGTYLHAESTKHEAGWYVTGE